MTVIVQTKRAREKDRHVEESLRKNKQVTEDASSSC